jgi:hypothetical protein
MKKLFWLIPAVCVCLCGCQKKEALTGLPSEIKVVKRGGITIRSSRGTEYTQMGAVLYGKTYRVVDGFPGYYKIRTVDGGEGWISAGYDDGWTERTPDGKVRIAREGGVTIRKAPFNPSSRVLGVAAEKYSFEVLDAEYFYFKIVTPEGKEGWVYAGNPENHWVEPVTGGAASQPEASVEKDIEESPASTNSN